MNSYPVLNFRDFIAAEGQQLTTTSQQVAAVFRKRHAHVLDAIRSLVAQLPPEFNEPNFRSVAYIDAKGESRVEYMITRDGFALLAMGFTGKKALAFKLAYIAAFNAMEAFIQNQREGLTYRKAVHELKCIDSSRRGSFHGRGLNERKQEIPALKAEEMTLLQESQPGLFLN